MNSANILDFAKGSQFCVYVELECQDTFKCSDPVYCLDCKKVRIDHSVHIFIEVIKMQALYLQRITIKLISPLFKSC